MTAELAINTANSVTKSLLLVSVSKAVAAWSTALFRHYSWKYHFEGFNTALSFHQIES